MKEDPRATRAITRANGAFNYRQSVHRIPQGRTRPGKRSLKRETTALDEAKKAKTKDEKAVADKTAPAEKAAARVAAAAKAAEARRHSKSPATNSPPKPPSNKPISDRKSRKTTN